MHNKEICPSVNAFRERRILLEKLKIDIPEKAAWILKTLNEAGYESYVVGGCVRDALLGRNPTDWDITTSAKPEEVKRLFPRTIDTGIAHGTVTVMVHREGFEVTTYRLDGAYEDSRHPSSVTFTGSLREDLRRRDFTINAMAYHPEKGLVDLFGGVEDMDAKCIRCVGDPMDRFGEDALRMMRAVRFSSQLGFQIEEKTKNAVRSLALNLRNISAERIQAELFKILESPWPEKIRDAYELGITSVILPEFDRCMITEQNTPFHCYTVGEHIIHSVMYVRQDRILRLTMLLHDIAKPLMKKTDEDGRDHFKQHAEEGEILSGEIMRRLKMDNDTIRKVTRLIRWHDYRPSPDMKAVRKAVHLIGEDLFPLYLEVQRADMLAQSMYRRDEKENRQAGVAECWKKIRENGECVSLKTMAVTGKDLLAHGMSPGPQIGEILNRMLEHVLLYPEDNEKQVLLDKFC